MKMTKEHLLTDSLFTSVTGVDGSEVKLEQITVAEYRGFQPNPSVDFTERTNYFSTRGPRLAMPSDVAISHRVLITVV